MGINTALRIGDLLKLKFKDVGNFDKDEWKVKDEFIVKEQKTGRIPSIKINQNLHDAIEFYVDQLGYFDPERYLFKSKLSDQPLTPSVVYKKIQEWTKDTGCKGNFGTHSLRKTWGYMARTKHGVPIELIQEKLGHKSPSVTRRYIGITKDEIGEVEQEVNL